MSGHVCANIDLFPLDKFHQIGKGKGKKILIVGESPSPKGWIFSGRACYQSDGKILPTGKRLNELLDPFDISVEISGFTELAKCFISKRSDLENCSRKCWPIFLNQIRKKNYKLLILLGVHTTKIFSKLIDKELIIGEMSDIKLNGKFYKVLPIFHPSPINHKGRLKNKLLLKKNYQKIEMSLL